MRKVLLVAVVIALAAFAFSQCQTILPGIVYQHAWYGETAALYSSGSPLTVYTPSASGLYRVNLAVSGVGGMHVIAESTFGSQSNPALYCYASNQSGNGPQGNACVFEGQSGVPITLDVRVLDSGTSYDALMTVEQLQ